MAADRDAQRANPLHGIEALRAAAALAVVAYHAGNMMGSRLGVAPPAALQNGAAGVDVFFVISGFVMIVSRRRLQGRPGAAWQFMRARLRRIVPLYWVCSGAKILGALAAPSPHGGYTAAYCLASLLFLPVHDAAGRFQPVVAAGWTLSFEMMFYALFAAALALHRPPARLVPPVLALIVLLPHAGWVGGEMTSPIILEFAFGTTLAAAWLSGWRLPPMVAGCALAASLLMLAALPRLALGSRVASWGMPAALLVAAIVSLEAALAPRLPRAILALGAASYAIYLTHGAVLAALAALLARLPAAAHPAFVVLCAACAASAAIGWIVHLRLELPIMRALKDGGGSPPEVLVLAGGGLSPLSGGVGTLMGNLMESWAQTGQGPRIRIVDTRGQAAGLAWVPRFAGCFVLLAWLCAAGRVQLIHAHMTTRGSAARKTLLCGLAMLLGVKVILHMHGADFLPFHGNLPKLLRWPLDRVLRRARHVVVLGAGWRQFLVREVGVDPARISIVPNGVPARTACARPAGSVPRIVFLGRLCARKGVPELIAALALPELRARPWQATIAGDGNAAPFRAMLSWHGLQERVVLPGWLDAEAKAALLAQADLLVLPSHHEALPLAVLEALAAKVAVITTPVGAIPEFLESGTHALLVQPGAPGELAAAILRLLVDGELRAHLAHSGHALFQERLEIGRVAARVAELYRDALLPQLLAVA